VRALLPALLWPVGAFADTLADTHFSMNFCWERAYSVQHLAEHPDQTVTTIRLRREPMGFPKAPGETLMQIEVTFRGGGGRREGPEAVAIGYCRPDGDARLLCGIEGDGGSYRIEAQGGHEILLAPGSEGMHFETREAFHELREDEGDDRAFLLRRCG
jgi:hypothetical protein